MTPPTYLPPETAFGCEYAFDPNSRVLRDAILRPDRYQRESIRTAALIADLPLLRQILEETCSGYDRLIDHPDFDADEFFASWVATLTHSGRWSDPLRAVVEPFQFLQRIVPNGHLTVVGLDSLILGDPAVRFHECQARYEPIVPMDRIALDLPRRARPDTLRITPMLSGRRIDHVISVSLSGKPEPFVAAGVQFTPRPAKDRTRATGRPAYESRIFRSTTVIEIRSFQTAVPETGTALEKFIDDYPLHRSQDALIFDLRANTGGDLRPIRRWLGRARPDGWSSWPMVEIMGPVAVSKTWNWAIEWQIRNGTVDTPEATQQRRELMTHWESLARSAPTIQKTAERSGIGTLPLDARVVAVVDRYTGSSGELAAIELKNAVGAIIVGERTAGACETGQAARFVLPETGLLVQVPTQTAFFEQPVEGVGWPVNVYLDDSKWTADRLPLIAEKLNS